MKSSIILLLLGTSVVLISYSVSRQVSLFGALIGYWLGFVYTGWLYRDTLRSVQDDVSSAIVRMRRSFFARLGVVSLVVAVVASYDVKWLLTLALGIAAGLFISLLGSVKHNFLSRKG